jgi:peptidoglycan/LPS O-acetylase OafA/YrhL
VQYRPEIDGLRAVAVIPVLFFHAGFRPAAGGFVGVDVFFVISGYLITSIILNELSRGRFSLLDFYERRARRILPALYFVLIVCIPFGYMWMLSDEFSGFLETVVATVFFVSNFELMTHTGYFGGDMKIEPLLHTWSLAIEEQYYLLAPALLWLCWRGGLGRVTLVVAAVSLGSLALAEVGWRSWPVANFYMLPTRAWELGLGSMAAIVSIRWPHLRPGGTLAELGGAAGLGLIALAVLTFDRYTPFPSLYTLVPTVGAALIILCADRRTLAGRLLAWTPAVSVGLISYSAYLWHQPILAFARIRSLYDLSDAGRLGAIGLALALAWLTWRFVERPFRDRSAVSAPTVLRLGMGASLGLVLVSAAAISGWTLRSESPPHLRQIFDVTDEQRYSYVVKAYEAEVADAFSEAGRKKLLLVGDSYSQDFYNMSKETGAFADYQVAGAFIEPWCQVYIGDEEVTRFIDPVRRRRCPPRDEWNASALALAERADVVVFAFKWEPWGAERLPETLANFRFRPDQRVLVIGGKSFGLFNVRALYGAAAADLPEVRSQPDPTMLEANDILRDALPPERFIDLQALICLEAGECPLFTPDGKIISYDGGHLTRAGARFVGARLFSDPRLRKYLGEFQG